MEKAARKVPKLPFIIGTVLSIPLVYILSDKGADFRKPSVEEMEQSRFVEVIKKNYPLANGFNVRVVGPVGPLPKYVIHVYWEKREDGSIMGEDFYADGLVERITLREGTKKLELSKLASAEKLGEIEKTILEEVGKKIPYKNRETKKEKNE